VEDSGFERKWRLWYHSQSGIFRFVLERRLGFKAIEVSSLLAKCHRQCCVCHRFCGVKIELDHIDPQADGGSDDIDNAIPVCFDRHAEIHSYNEKHPSAACVWVARWDRSRKK
jgi:hypothetical protein